MWCAESTIFGFVQGVSFRYCDGARAGFRPRWNMHGKFGRARGIHGSASGRFFIFTSGFIDEEARRVYRRGYLYITYSSPRSALVVCVCVQIELFVLGETRSKIFFLSSGKCPATVRQCWIRKALRVSIRFARQSFNEARQTPHFTAVEVSGASVWKKKSLYRL